MSQYLRHCTAPLDAIIPEIKAHWDEAEPYMVYGGHKFNIYSLRLKTFCRAAYQGKLYCSNCNLPATHFAVESFKHGSSNSVHVNLYGLNAQGHDVLFTHDHTLARALGGLNNLSNTSVMCFPCNNKKGIKEGELAREKRRASLTEKQIENNEKLLEMQKNPVSIEILLPSLIEWAKGQSEKDFAKRIDTYLQKFGWKRKHLKELISQGLVQFHVHPVRD